MITSLSQRFCAYYDDNMYQTYYQDKIESGRANERINLMIWSLLIGIYAIVVIISKFKYGISKYCYLLLVLISPCLIGVKPSFKREMILSLLAIESGIVFIGLIKICEECFLSSAAFLANSFLAYIMIQ